MSTSTSVLPTRPQPAEWAGPTAGAPRLSRQALSFLVIGGIATVVDVVLFNVLHYRAGLDPVSAKGLSTVAGAVVAFAGNRQFSFGDQTGNGMRRQAVLFGLVSVVALGLSVLPIVVARYGLGLTGVLALNAAGNVVGLALATAFRFWACRTWVFPSASVAVTAPLPVLVDEPVAA